MPGATKIWATVQLLPQAGALLPFKKRQGNEIKTLRYLNIQQEDIAKLTKKLIRKIK